MLRSGEGARELSDLEQWQIAEIKKGIAEADRGEFASDEEVEQTLKRLMRWRTTERSLIEDAHRKW